MSREAHVIPKNRMKAACAITLEMLLLISMSHLTDGNMDARDTANLRYSVASTSHCRKHRSLCQSPGRAISEVSRRRS